MGENYKSGGVCLGIFSSKPYPMFRDFSQKSDLLERHTPVLPYTASTPPPPPPPLSKRVCKRLLKRVSRVVAFIIELYREYESRGRPCHCAENHNRAPLRRLVGDINAFQNNFAFIISTETGFWLKRVSDRTFSAFRKGVSNPLIKQLCVYHLQKSP